jgi:hypothetical protein
MKFYYLLPSFFTILSTIICVGQTVKTKDGVSLGNRAEFISACSKGADKRLMNINGLEIETYKYSYK